MTPLEGAIRAACIADKDFILNRRPKLAARCEGYLQVDQAVSGEALYIHAQEQPDWWDVKRHKACAWEIFVSVYRLLAHAQHMQAIRDQNEKLLYGERRPVPSWMVDADEQEEPRLGERIAPPPRRSLPVAPAPEKPPLPERKKAARRG